MNQPSHETVAQRAHQIWLRYGRPSDRDQEIWFEAEHQLTDAPPQAPADSWARESSRTHADSPAPASATARIKSETAAASVVEYHLSPAPTTEEAIKAAVQSKAARAPIVAHHTGPKAKPVESGKPLWDRPHSS